MFIPLNYSVNPFSFCDKATSGGAHKFADLFKERLRFSPDKEDEMSCLVARANFLLKVNLTLGIIYFLLYFV